MKKRKVPSVSVLPGPIQSAIEHRRPRLADLGESRYSPPDPSTFDVRTKDAGASRSTLISKRSGPASVADAEATQSVLLSPAVKRPDVFAAAASANRMTYPLVATSGTITVNDQHHSEIFVPRSLGLRGLTVSYSGESASAAALAGQRAFLAGRFDRVDESGQEVAISTFYREQTIYFPTPPAIEGKARAAFSIDGWRYAIHDNGYEGWTVVYENWAQNAEPVSTPDGFYDFGDGTMQVKTSPAHVPYNASRVYFHPVFGDMIIIMVRRIWTTRTRVVETLGPVLPGTKERMRVRSLSTTTSVKTRPFRVF